jgi:hypothetical protein
MSLRAQVWLAATMFNLLVWLELIQFVLAQLR